MGCQPDELDDIALPSVHATNQQKYDAYERATNKTVVLKDHLEGYLAVVRKDGAIAFPRPLNPSGQMLAQFCRRFERLEKGS